MSTNNLDSLASSPFGTLSAEVTQYILEFVNPKDVSATQGVCHELKDQVDGFIANQWNKIKKLPLEEPIPLKEMMISLEKENPKASSLTLFRKLTKCFRDTYKVDISSKTVPCTAKEIGELLKCAKQKIEDQSLITLWENIQGKLHLTHPPKIAAEEIRTWMNDPANAAQLNLIIELNIAGRKLRTIPPEIKFLTQLQMITFRNNAITQIPDEIRAFTNLQELDLSFNKKVIAKLHLGTNSRFFRRIRIRPQIAYCKSSMSLCGRTKPVEKSSNLYPKASFAIPSKIKEISAAICELAKLQKLHLNGSQITVIPNEIAALTQLTVLGLSDNEITQISDEISALTNLQELYLNYNKIKEISAAVCKLSKLQNLYLKGNQITVIPNEIAALTQLTRLDLSQNEMTQIPDEIRALTNLLELDLSCNKIKEISAAVCKLPKLQKLDLRSNKIAVIPKVIVAFTQLTELDLSNNQIKKITAAIAVFIQLKKLVLNNNQIKKISPAMSSLTQLQGLYLCNNQIEEFPVAICALIQLKFLVFSNNQIKEIPVEIGALIQLESLDIDNNQIKKITAAIGALPQLQYLSLKGNQITVIPNEIAALNKLRHLSIYNNPIKELLCHGTSALAQLYQVMLGGGNSKEMKSLLDNLSVEDKKNIFFNVWILGGKLSDDGYTWGEKNVFDNVGRFLQAVRTTLQNRLDNLTQEQKNAVYRIIYELEGRPVSADLQWGEHHATDNLPLLADALALVLGNGS